MEREYPTSNAPRPGDEKNRSVGVSERQGRRGTRRVSGACRMVEYLLLLSQYIGTGDGQITFEESTANLIALLHRAADATS
ncbi:hypothetical protein VSR68_38795 [Paraburkholderia phymatum]|uniref:hypothetical protein n=1 Tax=Paraburkholderia phymatum TaxID=148447 RepID=UPI00316BC403